MEKRIKFSDQPKKVKIVYATVIAVLCITAVVIGIVSAVNKDPENPQDEPVINVPSGDEGGNNQTPNETPNEKPDETPKDEEPKKLSFISPVKGEVTKGHSLEVPVFSDTLQEWRVHTGLDIAAEEGSEVCAAEEGIVTKVYADPFLGRTVEITHEGGIVTVYSNLESGTVAVKEGDKVNCGALIGHVGDTSLSELADESHLHFAMKLNGKTVNPSDYLTVIE